MRRWWRLHPIVDKFPDRNNDKNHPTVATQRRVN